MCHLPHDKDMRRLIDQTLTYVAIPANKKAHKKGKMSKIMVNTMEIKSEQCRSDL